MVFGPKVTCCARRRGVAEPRRHWRRPARTGGDLVALLRDPGASAVIVRTLRKRRDQHVRQRQPPAACQLELGQGGIPWAGTGILDSTMSL